MGVSWKANFKPTNFGPTYDNPLTFIISQWQNDKDTPSWIYLLVRLAIFITFFVIWILTITMETPAGRVRWGIYLTNWGLSLCLIQSCLSCIMLIGALVNKNIRNSGNWDDLVSRLYSTYWVFNVMATTVAFTITFIYWTLIYRAEGAYWSTMNFMVHGFNSILMLFDFWMVSHPVRILHFIYPVIITLAYTTMSAIYFVCGGTTKNGSRYIYPILKWDEPVTTILYCVGVALLMIVIHILTYFMYLLRDKIYECCCSKSDADSVPDPSEIRML